LPSYVRFGRIHTNWSIPLWLPSWLEEGHIYKPHLVPARPMQLQHSAMQMRSMNLLARRRAVR
jgi:hypothetical protein